MHFSHYKPMTAPAPAPTPAPMGELSRGWELAGSVTNLFSIFISIINALYKAREGSIDDIQVADIMNQLLNAGTHILYTAIIHNDDISWICAAIDFVLVFIYLVIYWKYASPDQRKLSGVRRVSVIVIMISSIPTAVILNIIPFLNKHISRIVVNAIFYIVITFVCSLYALISLLYTDFCDGKIIPSVMQIMQIIFQIGSYILLLINAWKMGDHYMKITNIDAICSGFIIAFNWFIFGCYNLCCTAPKKETKDIERGETSEGTPTTSLLQTQPEPDTQLQNMGTATRSADDLMSGTDVPCYRTSSETRNPSASALALPHSPGKDEGAASTSANATLFSVQNMKSKTPANLEDQTLATPTGSVDYRKSTTVFISSHASSDTQNKSALGMISHDLEPPDSALASLLSPLTHSPAKEEGVAPTSVDSTLSSIPNVESETPINLQDQTSAMPTGYADDRKSTIAVISSNYSSETQNKLAPNMTCHELDPSAAALPIPLPPLPHSQAKEECAPPTSVYSTHSSIPNMESETPTNLKDQTLAIPTGSADERKSAAAVSSSLASSETQNQSAPHIIRPILKASASALASTSSPLHHSTTKEESAASSFSLPVSTVTAQAPFVDGPSPYQGLHGQAEGGLFGAPPQSFTLAAPS